MMVCAHGNVADFCKKRDMYICDTWSGDLRDYRGTCRVLVTDADLSLNEYYYLKGELLRRGVEMISTRHVDDERVTAYLMYASTRRTSGRRKFSDRVVMDRIRELRAEGKTLREIRDTEGVCHPNGKKLSLSTISKIVENEEKE